MASETAKQAAPVAPGIFTMPSHDAGLPALLGGQCSRCNRRFFPRPIYCPQCLGPVEGHPIGSRGRIHVFTVVRIKPPFGLPQPYAVGYIDMEENGLRIFSLLDPLKVDELAVGQEVVLSVGVLGHDGKGVPRLRPYFTPVKKRGAGKEIR